MYYFLNMSKEEYFSKVIKVVAELSGVSEMDILSKSRVKEVVDARWMAIYFMRKAGCSTKEISRLVRHPERTVNHALKALPNRLKLIASDIGNNFVIAEQQLL